MKRPVVSLQGLQRGTDMEQGQSDQKIISMGYDSLEIIRQSLQLVSSGNEPFYRVIAVQLRMLLCDTTRRHGKIVDLSLMPKILPDLKMHAMDGLGQPVRDRAALPVKEWLQQKLVLSPSSSLTIRQFIRQVCDQDGGAHFDPKNDRVFDESESYRHIIVNLGRYLFEAAAPEFIRLLT